MESTPVTINPTVTAVDPVDASFRRKSIDKSKEFLKDGLQKGLYGRRLKRWATRKTQKWMNANRKPHA